MTPACFALLASIGLACTEPSYGTTRDADSAIIDSDAGRRSLAADSAADTAPRGARDDAAADAAEVRAEAQVTAPKDPQDAGPAGWWTPLTAHKNYAVRVHFFAYDRALGTNVAFSHEILFWATLGVDAASGSVAMDLWRCVDRGVVTSSITLRDDFSWTYAARLPAEKHTLVMRDGKIRSESAARTLGYKPTQPDDCTPGARIAARPDQVWLRDGKCECRNEPLPVLATDCRLTDIDQDGRPGVTITHVGFADKVEGARVKDNCQFDNGVLDADGRLRANYVENYDVLDVTCGNNPCTHNDVVSCPLQLNSALFEPLPDVSPEGEPWDCAKVVIEAERRLPSQMLGFPQSGC